MKKNVFSLFLAALMIVSSLVIPNHAQATYSRTMDEVRAWLDNEAAMQNVYHDGECPWFCNHYLVDFWGENGIYGVENANGWVGHCPPNWTNTGVDGNPDNFRMGDLIVEVYPPNGHVMVYYGKGSDGRHYVVDSNFQNNHHVSKHIWYEPLSQETYCYRPPINVTNYYPDKPTLTVRQNFDFSLAIPEWNSVFFLWTSGGSNCTHYNLYVYNADTGEHIDTYWRITSNHLNLQLPPGNYKFRIAAVNNYDPNVYYTFSDYTSSIAVQEYTAGFHSGITSYQGHTYAVLNYEGIATADWGCAKKLCEMLGGHLPTISNSAENETIKSLVAAYGNPYLATWLGASEVEQEGDWQWVTGESFSYTNWDPGQPDNRWNTEKYLAMYPSGKWCDLHNTERGNIVVEFDYLPSSFPHNVLKEEDFKGHTYTLYEQTMYDWYDAKAFCESQGGTLLCIESEQEQDFINSFTSELNYGSVFLGATDSDSEGNWKWLTGESLTYTNWDSANYDPNGGAEENNAIMWLHPTRKGTWADANGNGSLNYIIMERGPALLLGDADNNGTVDSVDALLILRYALGIVDSLPSMDNADVTGDGEVDSVDALMVLRYALGIITL